MLMDVREQPQYVYFTLRMEAANSSKTLVFYLITAWHHSPEDHDLDAVRCTLEMAMQVIFEWLHHIYKSYIFNIKVLL
jgi:hypothetical protein